MKIITSIELIKYQMGNLFLRFTIIKQSFVGKLGWLDTNLPIYIIYSYIAMMFIATLNGDGKIFNLKNRSIMILIFLFTSIIIMTALYITWNVVGGSLILGVQGRYFIAVALLLFLAFDSKKLNLKNLDVILVLYVVFVLSDDYPL